MYRIILLNLILVSLVFSTNVRKPEKRQLPVPYPYYNPFLPPNAYFNPKNFFGLISTSTTTSTSVVTTTCTVSTGTACRRRRGVAIEQADDFNPSAPLSLEATPINDMANIRESREPSPQNYYTMPDIGYQAYYDINPSFERNVQRPFPYSAPFAPYAPHAPQALPDNERLFFNVFVVTTVTTTSTTTSTSRPTCSSASNFNRC